MTGKAFRTFPHGRQTDTIFGKGYNLGLRNAYAPEWGDWTFTQSGR
jgi:hypothetical protein